MLRNLHKNTGLHLGSLLLYKDFISKYSNIAQEVKFTIKDFFNKCEQSHSLLQILLKYAKEFLGVNIYILCGKSTLCIQFIHRVGGLHNTSYSGGLLRKEPAVF